MLQTICNIGTIDLPDMCNLSPWACSPQASHKATYQANHLYLCYNYMTIYIHMYIVRATNESKGNGFYLNLQNRWLIHTYLTCGYTSILSVHNACGMYRICIHTQSHKLNKVLLTNHYIL